MTLPSTLPDALAMLGQLVADPNLVLGLQTVALVLVGSGLVAAAILRWAHR